jgi:prefoldin subunit 5
MNINISNDVKWLLGGLLGGLLLAVIAVIGFGYSQVNSVNMTINTGIDGVSKRIDDVHKRIDDVHKRIDDVGSSVDDVQALIVEHINDPHTGE